MIKEYACFQLSRATDEEVHVVLLREVSEERSSGITVEFMLAASGIAFLCFGSNVSHMRLPPERPNYNSRDRGK